MQEAAKGAIVIILDMAVVILDIAVVVILEPLVELLEVKLWGRVKILFIREQSLQKVQ